MATLQEKLAAKRAEMKGAPVKQQDAEMSVRQKLEAKKAEMNAPPRPIDYSQKREIGEMSVKGLPLMDQAKASGGLMLDARPEAQINILKEYVPGVEADFDDEGNAFVKYKGEEYYLNKPGLSPADVTQFAADVVQFVPAAKIASLGKTFLARLGIGAASYGSTSAAQDLAGNALGSDQSVDPVKAGISAIFGGAAEAVTPFVMQGVRRLFSSNKLYQAGKGLTDQGKKMVKDLGFDPDVFNESAAKEFADLVSGKVDPKTAASLAENKAFGIRTTRGEATQDFGLIQKEDIARKGGYGDRAQNLMEGFDDAKTQEMLAAKDTVQRRLGDQSVAREVEGAGIVAEGVKSRAASQSRVIDKAYQEAAQYDARLDMDSIKGFAKSVRARINDGDTLIDKTLTPSTVRALKEIDGLTKGKEITALSLKRMEATRRKLGQMIEAAANPADRRSVTIIKGELDGFLDDAFDRALFEGDDLALDALKTARSARKKYGDLFEKRGSGDVAGKEMEKIVRFDADENQTLSYLFGKGRLGGKDGSSKIAARIKDALGSNSPEWQAFKETAFLRLMKGAAKEHNGKTTFNGQVFVRNFDQAMNDAPKLMKTVFVDALPYVRSFRNALDRATYRPPGSVNTSGTGVAISRMAQDSFQRIATVMGLTGDLSSYVGLRVVGSVAGKAGRNYAKSVRPALPGSSFASALAAATGAAGTRSQFQQPSASSRSESGTR
jgi:hypothetical protein